LIPEWALAKPIIVQTPVSDSVTTVLMSDKLLGPFLLLNAVQLLFFLLKSIFNSEKKRLEEIQKAVSHIPLLIERMEKLDSHVQKNVPTKDLVEVMIWKHMREKDQ